MEKLEKEGLEVPVNNKTVKKYPAYMRGIFI